MALTYEETVKLEELKQNHKKELVELNGKTTLTEHEMKMERLKLMLDIAKAGGMPQQIEEDD